MAAERTGFDQLWVSNDLLLRSAPVLIGALSARTSRIQLGIGIMNPYTVHPTELAMLAATAQEVSGGRFLLGIGAGAPEFLGWAGIERRRPMGTTRQSVAALRKLLGHTDVDHQDLPAWWSDSAFLRFDVSAPVLVYVGAMGPQMRRLSGAVADGALPLLYPPEQYAAARDDVRAGCREAGRDPAAFDLPACIWVSVGAERPARRALAEKLAYYGPSISEVQLAAAGLTPQQFEPAARYAQVGEMEKAVELIDDQMLTLGVAGSPDQVLERCRGLVALGAEHISFGPPLGPDVHTAIELLGRDVIPDLRATCSAGHTGGEARP
ncbi:MAG: LLM class flavin-dependent oxidoreductase [Streptosporangiales bacterium]|nr:LLM class flavin-dependent oxidoreductase [Streptosporangiales bacterium]